MSLANLQKVYDQSTERDRQIAISSYWKYHRLTAQIAAKHGSTSKIGAAVFAALSPNNDYWGNLRDVDTLIGAWAAGKNLADFNVSAYGSNKRKAWEIAHGADPDALIVALKTCNFFHNVDNPDDPNWVTIDGHMFNIFHGIRRPLQSRNNKNRVVKVGKWDYIEISAAVKTFAENHRLIPCQMQGILWGVWRKMHNIANAAQGYLWDWDYTVAGLGFQTESETYEKP